MKMQQGFTLVEIAIVLVIVGLLLGGVLKGSEMIDNARVRNVIQDMDGLKAAVFAFQDRFQALPGDMNNAVAVIGGPNVVNCATNCNNGQINPWPNTSLVTNHLSAAGFYSGAFNTAQGANFPQATANAPRNAYGGAMFVAFWNQYSNAPAGAAGNQNGIYTGNTIPASALAEIDTKIDDGNPTSGSFRLAFPSLGAAAAAACVNGAAWQPANVGGNNCSGVSLY